MSAPTTRTDAGSYGTGVGARALDEGAATTALLSAISGFTSEHARRWARLTRRAAAADLRAGDRVQFAADPSWWQVRATSPSGNYVVLTQPAGAAAAYTVISWPQRRRGPHTSQSPWPIETDEQCGAIAIALDFGAATSFTSGLVISEQHAVPLAIHAVRRIPSI